MQSALEVMQTTHLRQALKPPGAKSWLFTPFCLSGYKLTVKPDITCQISELGICADVSAQRPIPVLEVSR